MAFNETPVIQALVMDRAEPIGNSTDSLGRRALHVLPTGGALPISYQAWTVAYPTTHTEVWSFRSGSTTGPVVATLTLIYADAEKTQLISGEVVIA